MKHEKTILISIYVVLFSLLGVFIFHNYHASVTGKFYIVGENKTLNISNNCSEINVITTTANVPLSYSNKTIMVNPLLFNRIGMPKEFSEMYNITRPPTFYGMNESLKDIVIIGDSYSAGAAVKYNETFAYYLSKYYNVINLGIGGYNTKMEVERLKKVGLKYNPNTIVLQYCENDWENTYELWSYIRNASILLSKNGYDCIKDPLSSDSPVFMKLIHLYYKEVSKNKSRYFLDDVISPLNEFYNISKNKKIPVIFILLPSPKYQEEILKPLVKKYNWTLINIRNETNFNGWHPPFTVSKANAHFSPQTHYIVGKLLKEQIDEILK